MLVVRESGEVVFQSPRDPLKPRPGETVVCYLHEPRPTGDTGMRESR